MTDIRIQPMDVTHLAEILDIEASVFGTPWTRGMFEEEIARDPDTTYAVVAMGMGRVIGYTVAWFLQDAVHLLNIAVHEEWQKHGVGSHLMNHLFHEAREAGMVLVTLEVRQSNAVAQTFYRSFGFVEVGVRRGYYTDNREDAVLMAADLDSLVRRSDSDNRPSRLN